MTVVVVVIAVVALVDFESTPVFGVAVVVATDPDELYCCAMLLLSLKSDEMMAGSRRKMGSLLAYGTREVIAW